MLIQHQSYASQEQLNEYQLDVFFNRTLQYLQIELEKLRRTIYNYNEWHYLFELNETAWVGVFSNAIIRAFPETAATLQEYLVYNDLDKTPVGRADLLVNWINGKGETIYLLFEAKQYIEQSECEMLGDSTKYLEQVLTQGCKYYSADSKYFNGKTVFIIPLIFGCINQEAHLNVAKSFFDQKPQKDKSIDFCTLYFEGQYGTWVYGKIYPAKKVCTK